MKINKYNHNHIPKIFQSAMVKEISQEDLDYRILDLITNAGIIMTVKLSKEDKAYLVGVICCLIRKRYKTIRMDEFDIIFENGAFGEYGNNYGKLDGATINNWIRQYRANERYLLFLKSKEMKNEASPMCEKIRLIRRNIDKMPSLKKIINFEIDQTQ